MPRKRLSNPMPAPGFSENREKFLAKPRLAAKTNVLSDAYG
jgi:hypothetical protein